MVLGLPRQLRGSHLEDQGGVRRGVRLGVRH